MNCIVKIEQSNRRMECLFYFVSRSYYKCLKWSNRFSTMVRLPSSFDIRSRICVYISYYIRNMLSIVADWQPKYWIDCDEGQTMFVIDTSWIDISLPLLCAFPFFNSVFIFFSFLKCLASIHIFSVNIYTFDLQLGPWLLRWKC